MDSSTVLYQIFWKLVEWFFLCNPACYIKPPWQNENMALEFHYDLKLRKMSLFAFLPRLDKKDITQLKP